MSAAWVKQRSMSRSWSLVDLFMFVRKGLASSGDTAGFTHKVHVEEHVQLG